jgi:hypothetical protein
MTDINADAGADKLAGISPYLIETGATKETVDLVGARGCARSSVEQAA